jgi:hypothetical protein
MKCWICGQEGNTGEHMIKASDIRSYFGNISQKNPIFFHTKEKRNISVGSLKSKRFKFDSLICNNCNSSLTQPYDRAWELLSAYLRSNWPDLLKFRKVKLAKIFPGSVHRSMLFVHLYFVKIFGCKIVVSEAPIATESISEALLNKKAHKDIFIAFAPKPGKVDHKYAALTPIHSMDIDGISAFATWLYMIDNLAVNIIYAPKYRAAGVMKDTWHPDKPNKIIKIKDL